MVYSDLLKVFDSLNNIRLVEELNMLEIQALVFNLIKSYLSECSQIITVNNALSESIYAKSDVPQVSHLELSCSYYL